MKAIEIKKISLGDKDAYSSMSYPEAGCFEVQENSYNLFFVNKGSVYTIPFDFLMVAKEIKDQEHPANDFILELIAISQNPELIIGLRK